MPRSHVCAHAQSGVKRLLYVSPCHLTKSTLESVKRNTSGIDYVLSSTDIGLNPTKDSITFRCGERSAPGAAPSRSLFKIAGLTGNFK